VSVEDVISRTAADAAGMAGFLVAKHRYLPVADIDKYVAENTAP
jgi:hypothetical protein